MKFTEQNSSKQMAPIPCRRHRNSVHGKEVGKTLGALAGALPILVLFLVRTKEYVSQTGSI